MGEGVEVLLQEKLGLRGFKRMLNEEERVDVDSRKLQLVATHTTIVV